MCNTMKGIIVDRSTNFPNQVFHRFENIFSHMITYTMNRCNNLQISQLRLVRLLYDDTDHQLTTRQAIKSCGTNHKFLFA